MGMNLFQVESSGTSMNLQSSDNKKVTVIFEDMIMVSTEDSDTLHW